ncbi:hypothetical protein SAMN05192553_10695 [Cyclobacterium xiamenense]|uniref:EpsG family protein n=2 Tax=Cyclobacterium xiamenense TaxID=1297121 RepID=A0A1H7ACL5_9BACT|nr:hypothetical protein [Cyclobacterium xiamenense]SEJ61637.1 hypothetical protein SAMN05192553_10695 [Cyclobacterium xiamenense]
MLDIIVIVILLLALFKSNESISKKFRLPWKYQLHLHYLLVYHLFFSLFFTWYILNFGGDSQGYWYFTMEQILIRGDVYWGRYFGTSTTFILWLTYLPSRVLGLSYLTGNILFGALGFIGIRYLFVMTAVYFPYNHKVLTISLFPIIFYFPNMHFWTAGVGKDSICFWGIAWFVYAVQAYRKRWWQGLLALFFVYMARPHMGQALIAGAAISILFGSEIRKEYKIVLGILALFGSIYLSATTLSFLKLEEFSLEELGSLASKTAGLLASGHSGIDVASYSIPMRIFTFMFRPIFFDAHNVMAILSSFENALYLYLSFFIYRNWSPEALRDMPVFLKTGIIVFIPTSLAFANSLGNLGAIMRMKNMTMIYFLLFCFFLIAHNKKQRYLRAVDRQRFFQRRQAIIEQKQALSDHD